MKHTVLTFAAVILALFGAVLSAEMVRGHYQGKAEGGLLAAFCSEDGKSCDKVLSSRWSVFPPAPVEENRELKHSGNGQQKAFPVSALGLAYFLAVLSAVVLSALLPWKGRAVARLLRGTCILGIVGSIAFLCLMAFVIRAFCPLCGATHLVNFLLFGCIWLATRGVSEQTEMARRGSLLWGSVGLLAFLAAWNGLRFSASEARNQSLSESLNDGNYLEVAFIGLEKKEVEVRPDDPILPAPRSYAMNLVVWGDAQCPYCNTFDYQLQHEILPLFRGRMNITYKHYPAKIHPYALDAAKAMEAARLQDRFFAMKTAIKLKGTGLRGVNYGALAGQLGLDEKQFQRDFDSPEVLERIQDDVKQLHQLGSKGTPAVYLNGRLLDGRMRSLRGFWEARANSLRRVYESRGLEWEGDWKPWEFTHGDALDPESPHYPPPAPKARPTAKPVATKLKPGATPTPPPARRAQVRASQPVINLGEVIGHRIFRKTITLENTGQEPVTLQKMEALPGLIQLSGNLPMVIPGGQKRSVIANCFTGVQPRSLNTPIRFQFDQGADVVVAMRADVSTPVQFLPPSANFGKVSAGASIDPLEIQILNFGPRPLSIRSVQVNGTGFMAMQREVVQGSEYAVTVTPTGVKGPGTHRAQLEIQTNYSRDPLMLSIYLKAE